MITQSKKASYLLVGFILILSTILSFLIMGCSMAGEDYEYPCDREYVEWYQRFLSFALENDIITVGDPPDCVWEYINRDGSWK